MRIRALLAVSVLYAGSRPAEAKDKVASRGADSPVAWSSGPNSVAMTVEEAKHTLEYWTPKRMANATPMPPQKSSPSPKTIIDQPLPPNSSSPSVKGATPVLPADHTDKGLQKGAGPKAITPAEHTDAAEWTGPSTRPPATTTGKLFFELGGETWACSASAVDSPGKNLVFTAGHCLFSTPRKGDPDWSNAVWADDVMFAPGYREGSEPYGRWPAQRFAVRDKWAESGNFGYDVGAAVVVPPHTLPGSNSLVEEVGANGIIFNEPAEQDAYFFGYPSNHANGERLYYCHDRSKYGGIFNPNMAWMICDFEPGYSGGPWLMNFNGETGYLFSVGSSSCEPEGPIHFCDSRGIQGPLFDDSVIQLHNEVVGTDSAALGTIAYQGWDGHDTEIYSMDSDGREQHPLTSNDQNDTYPTVSPDGARIAYSHVDGADAEIYTINATGGTPVPLTNNNTHDSRPSYSGDGTRIAYEGHDGNDWEIYTTNATGGTPDPVTDNNTDDRDPDYAPSGESIAYRGWDGNDYEIYTINATGGTPVPLTNNHPNDLGPEYAPSASGRETIAYQGWDDNDYEIYEVSSTGGPSAPRRQITYNDTGDGAPSYSPNGAHIVYMGDDGHDLEIYRINLTFGHVRQFTNNTTEDANPSWGIPRKTKVPNVVGSYSSAAGRAIRNAGLVPKFTGDPPGARSWVVSQKPSAHTVVDRGSTVTCRLTDTGVPN
jgi:V8-like Glu-specific endopeptidase